jgi:hypothetical protein
MMTARDRFPWRNTIRTIAFAGFALPASLVLMAGLVLARGEALIDIQWVSRLSPVRAAFNRDEFSPVQVAFRADGAVNSIPVRWSIRRDGTTIASRDTLVDPPPRGLEKGFQVVFPPLPPGAYALVLSADPEGTIDEKNEQNNEVAFSFRIPNGRPVLFRCEGPEGSSWEIRRIELNRGSGEPFPDSYGTKPDTTRTTDKEITVNGVEPGPYSGVLFGPPVNRLPILVSDGTFEMSDPPSKTTVVWQRTTPYLVGRPSVTGQGTSALGNDVAAPQWKSNSRVVLDGTIRNPTVRSEDVQWMLRFTDQAGSGSTVRDTLLSLGALATERVTVAGRLPRDPGMYLIQAEVRVPWPSNFQDLGEEDWVDSHVLPLGWIEILP